MRARRPDPALFAQVAVSRLGWCINWHLGLVVLGTRSLFRRAVSSGPPTRLLLATLLDENY